MRKDSIAELPARSLFSHQHRRPRALIGLCSMLIRGWRSGGELSGQMRLHLMLEVLMATFGLLGGPGKSIPRIA